MEKILVIAYTGQETSARLARMLCDRQGWPMAEVCPEQPKPGKMGAWWQWLRSSFGQQDAIVYRGPVADQFDAVVLVAPASSYRDDGAMCKLLSTFQDFKPDVMLLTVQGSRLSHEGAARVVDSTGRYPLLGMWMKPLELDFIGHEGRVQAFGRAVLASVSPTSRSSQPRGPVKLHRERPNSARRASA